MSYEIKSRKDLINLLNSRKLIPQLGLPTIILALGGTFIDAYDFGSISIGVIQLEQVLHLTSVEVGFMTAAMAFGALFGALFGGRLIDSIGRLQMFLLDLILFVIGALGAALSVNLAMLIGFRVLMGIGVGIDFPVSLSLIAEYSSLRSKGRNVNMWQAMWYIATVGIYAIALLLYYYYSFFGLNIWRWVIGLGAVPAFIIILLRFKYMGESALWTFIRGSKKEIELWLKKNGITNIVIPDTFESSQTVKSSFKMLFTSYYRKRTILASTIAMVQSMEYFAVGFYLPIILLAITHGNIMLSLGTTLLLNMAGIAGGTLQSLLTLKIGPRRLALIGLFSVVILLLSIGIIGNTISVLLLAILLGLFIFFHSFGQGSQGMTIGTLSYPTPIRGTGAGWSQAMVRVGSITGFFAFPLLKSAVGTSHSLLYIAIAPLVALIVTLIIRWDPIKAGDIEEEIEKLSSIEQSRRIK